MRHQSRFHSFLAVVLAMLTFQSVAAPAKAGSNPFFALCMDTHDAQKRSLPEQAALLKELGYDGAGHLWLAGLQERLRTLDAEGLKLFQVYFQVDIAPDAKTPFDPALEDALKLLKGRNTQLAVLVKGGKPSDTSLDDRAVEILRNVADLARPYGVSIALYPHVNDWLERVDDAVRVADKVKRSNLGIMFNLCHWLKASDEKTLATTLRAAKPHLMAVSINGSDTGADIRAGKGQWIAPLDSGAFDQLALLKILKELEYAGPIGLQCYGIPGDARIHLDRSIRAWRGLTAKLNIQ